MTIFSSVARFARALVAPKLQVNNRPVTNLVAPLSLARGASAVAVKGYSVVKKLAPKIFSNPFSGGAKAFLGRAVGFAIGGEALRQAFGAVSGRPVSVMPNVRLDLALAANPFTAAAGALAGAAYRGGNALINAYKNYGPAASAVVPNIPGQFTPGSYSAAPNFSFEQAPINVTSAAPTINIAPPSSGGGGISFSSGGGIDPLLALGLLGVVGAGAYGLARRKKYKRRKRRKKA